jgi:hypothetical protein
MSKRYGYNCTVCGEPIKEPQLTEHTDQGLAHAKCCEGKERICGGCECKIDKDGYCGCENYRHRPL